MLRTTTTPSADKADLRRRAILEAAGFLFTTNGFTGTTTLDIARRAGVSKRDLYAAFGSKEDILGALVASRVDRMSPQVRLGVARSRPEALATVAAFAAGLVRFLLSEDATGLYRLAIAGTDRQPEVGKALLEAGINGTIRRLADYVAQAVSAGFIAPVDVEAAVRAILAVASSGLQMRRLLDPAATIGDGEIDMQVERAMAVFAALEAAATASRSG